MYSALRILGSTVLLSLRDGSCLEVRSWSTNCDDQGNPINLLVPGSIAATGGEGLKNEYDYVVHINADSRSQQMVGFGAGLPQSSAYVLYDLKTRNVELYNQVMVKLFDKSSGAGLSILRFPMSSCDFSITNTSYDEVGGDYDLSEFALDADSEYIMEVIKDAQSINPDMTFIASPWSAPSWMKVMNTLLGMSDQNTLIATSDVYKSYGNFFKRALDEYDARGINVDYLTLQNEPLFGTSHEYPGMFLSSSDAYRLGAVVKQFVGDRVKLLAYDHNWDHPEYPTDILTSQSDNDIFGGTAWHCYGGDMKTALTSLQQSFPSLEQHITECTGGFPDNTCDINRGMESFGFNHEWDMKNIFLGPITYGSRSGTKWIIALDEECGPVLPLVTWRSGRPFVSIPSDADDVADIKYNQDYWTASHMAKFVSKGAYRVETEISGSNDAAGEIMIESFFDDRAGLTTSIAMNLDHDHAKSISFVSKNVSFEYEVPAFGTVIFQW